MIRRENRKVMSNEGKRERIFKDLFISIRTVFVTIF